MGTQDRFGEHQGAVEDIQEVVLEILQQNAAVQALVQEEFEQRFPGAPRVNPGMEQEHDEIICMCQLLVYRRILEEIVQ